MKKPASSTPRSLPLTPALVRQLGFRRVPKADFMEGHGVTLSAHGKPGTYVFGDYYAAKPLPLSRVKTAAQLVAGIALRVRKAGRLEKQAEFLAVADRE